MNATPTTRSLGQRATTGALWLFAKTAYVNLATLGAVVVLARLISPDKFGLVALASVFTALITVVTDLGLTPTLVRLRNPSRLQLNTAFWLSLGISVVLAVILCLLTPWLASSLHHHELRPILWVLSIQIPLSGLRLVPIATLTREMRFKALAIREVLSETAGTTVALVLAFAGYGAWALVAQSVGTVLVDVLVLWRAVTWRPRRAYSAVEARGLLNFGLTALLTQLAKSGRDRITDLIAGAMLGTTALGVWVIGGRIANIMLGLFATVVSTVALPTLSHAQGYERRMRRLFRRAVRTCSGLAFPSMLGLAVVSSTAVPLIFGDQWVASARVAELTAAAAAVATISWVDGALWWAIGKPRVEFVLTIVTATLQIVLTVGFAPLGVTWLALAMLAKNLIAVPLRTWSVKKYADFPYSSFADVPRIIASCIPMCLTAYLASLWLNGAPRALSLSVQVLVGTVAYAIASWYLQRSAVIELVTDLLNSVRRPHTRAATEK